MVGPRGDALKHIDDRRHVLDGPARHGLQRLPSVRALLLQHWAGRLLVGGLALRLGIWVLQRLVTTGSTVDTLRQMASLAAAVGASVILWRLSVVIRQRLLWRVRRKLILSYVFIGLVPALLIVVFFTILGALTMLSFSSFLVKEKLSDLQAQARVYAETTAVELQQANGPAAVSDLLARKLGAGTRRYPGMSIALVPIGPRAGFDGTQTGAWSHGPAPTDVPAWLGADSATAVVIPVTDERGVQQGARLIVRSVAWTGDSDRTRGAVIVDLPLDDPAAELIRAETGIRIGPASTAASREVNRCADRPTVTVTANEANPPGGALTLAWVNHLDVHEWDSGKTCNVGLHIEPNLPEVYRHITGAQAVGGSVPFGDLLLIILLVIGALFLVIQGVAFVMGVSLARSITGAIHELFEGTQRVQREEFSHRVHVPSRDQFGALATSFNQMTERIEELLEQKVEKDRLEQELQIARDIQTSLLPSEPLRIDGIAVAAACRPAREIGGDYCDFFPIDHRRIGILVADVSGKGASAALYMAELKGLVLALSKTHDSPRRLLGEVNRILSQHLGRSSFITMSYAVLDLDARTLTHARAGHTPLIHLRAKESFPRTRLLAPEGLVLGVRMESVLVRFDQMLKEQTIALDPGDIVVMFTDGVSEAMNDIRDLYGEDRLCLCVEQNAMLDPEALCDEIFESVREFADGAEQHDDMTMIVLKVDERLVA
jgi:sigma-B regulation protein RsbU (phosphoserine phosphatase)